MSADSQPDSPDRLSHITRVLLAIRNVNQLIVHETDPGRLIARACENLTETMGYFNAWIALVDPENHSRLQRWAHNGLSPEAAHSMVDALEAGQPPRCMRESLKGADVLRGAINHTHAQASPSASDAGSSQHGQSTSFPSVIVIEDPPAECPKCPISQAYEGCAGLCCSLGKEGRVYGVLAVSVPREFACDVQEQDLFAEVAQDLGFALWKIEESDAYAEIQRRYEQIFQGSRDGFVIVDADGRIRDANNAFCEMLGYSLAELRQMEDFYRITPDRWRQWEREVIWERRLLREGYSGIYRKEYIRKDGTVFPVELQAYTVRDESGEIGHLWGVVREVTEEVQAEQSLREASMRLDAACTAGGVGLWDWDLRSNEVFFSVEWKRQIGYEDHEIGSGFEEWESRVHPDDLPATQRYIADTIAGESRSYEVEFRFRHRDGSYRWILARASIFRDDDGRATRVMGCHIDITERKQTEQALRESERRFRSLLESLEIIPVQGYDDQRRVIYWNSASEAVYGYTAKEAMGRRLEDLIIPESMREEVIRSVDLWLSGGPAIPAEELTLRDREGNDVAVYSTHLMYEGPRGQKQFFCVDVDLRPLREAEEQLRRLATGIEQAGDIVVITDAEGRIEYVNPAFEQATGYRRDEALGQNPRILKSGEHEEAYYRSLWQALTAGRTWEGRFVNRRKDGSTYTEEAKISPVRDGSGRIVNYVAVKRDITRELSMEAQLRQAQKMDAVGRLAGGVAHDFNNKLQTILGYTDLLLSDASHDGPDHEMLSEIRNAAERSAALTRQLLAFARKQTISPQVLDLNETVGGMLKMLRRLIGENIELHWQPGTGLDAVLIDPAQIDQVLANLVVNARDAIEGVGRIVIETGLYELDGDSTFAAAGRSAGRYIVLSVSDDGCGMEAETLERIFEPFFTTKPREKGTGLGLATVYGIVQQNGGFADVSSKPGKGTSFRIFLPARTADDARRAEPDELPEEIGGPETVLVVEDDPAILLLSRRILEQLGYRVHCAESPEKAKETVRGLDRPVDLLLTDVIMPRMSGRDLWDELRGLQPSMKCLFMSGYTADVIAHRGVLDEGISFIQKPFSARGLGAKVREALGTDEDER